MIKATINTEPIFSDFPKLMIDPDDNMVILAVSENKGKGTLEGTILSLGTFKGSLTVGHSSDLWEPSDFKDFKGSVTLQGV